MASIHLLYNNTKIAPTNNAMQYNNIIFVIPITFSYKNIIGTISVVPKFWTNIWSNMCLLIWCLLRVKHRGLSYVILTIVYFSPFFSSSIFLSHHFYLSIWHHSSPQSFLHALCNNIPSIGTVTEVFYKLNNLKFSKCPVVWNSVIWHSWESGMKIGSFRKRENRMAESVEPQNRTDNVQKWFSVPPSQMTSVCQFLLLWSEVLMFPPLFLTCISCLYASPTDNGVRCKWRHYW